MSEYIPLEIQAEILKRLPLEPLLRCRTVSKSFKSLIDSQDFIVSYSADHPQIDYRYILRYQIPYEHHFDDPVDDKYLTCFDIDDDDYMYSEPGFSHHNFFIHPIPSLIKRIEPNSKAVGSSFGLLCFSGYYYEHSDDHSCRTDMVVLWNVSLRKSVGIRVPFMSDKPNGNFCDLRVDNVFGFGVCPVTYDPIVINITCIAYKREKNDIRHISDPWKVRVFTLSTGTWSNLSTSLPRESLRLENSQVVIGRFIYWIADHMYDPEDVRPQSRYLIMSFDLTAKEFKEISLTGSLTNRLCGIQSIAKLQESLVLLEYHREFEEAKAVCCLWLMKEQGDSRSFTKLYTIDLPYATINQILGFRKTGELIIETRKEYQRNGGVQIYKPHFNYTDDLEIDGEEYSFFLCPDMETLLLLDKPNGLYISSNSTYMITHDCLEVVDAYTN